jgi:hypothetical protein
VAVVFGVASAVGASAHYAIRANMRRRALQR